MCAMNIHQITSLSEKKLYYWHIPRTAIHQKIVWKKQVTRFHPQQRNRLHCSENLLMGYYYPAPQGTSSAAPAAVLVPSALRHAAEGGAEGTANPSRSFGTVPDHHTSWEWREEPSIQPHGHHWTLQARQTVTISPHPFLPNPLPCNTPTKPRRLSSHPVATSLANTRTPQARGCCSGAVLASHRQERRSGPAKLSMTEPTSASILKAPEKGNAPRNAVQASEPTPQHK